MKATAPGDSDSARPPLPAAAPVVVQNLFKSYRLGAVTVPVLRGVSLQVPATGLSVLSGPSGSGKTTLLNLIGLIDRPDSGQLQLFGADVGALSDNALSDLRRAHIGYVFQNFNLLPVLDAVENVEYPLLIDGVPAGRRRTLAMQALDAVGLADVSRHRPNQLSGGQRQRVAIARALVKEPSLMLADEPTASLDTRTGVEIIALLRRLQAQHGIAVVVCSHDPRVQAQADHAFQLRDGQLQAPPSVQDSRTADLATS